MIQAIKTKLSRIKRRLLKKPYLKDAKYPSFWFDKILGDKEAFAVQIGSNDGKTGDPLFPLFQKNPKWKALFVEPVPYSFEQLQANYSDTERFQFENVAINDGQSLHFYWVDKKAKEVLPDLPYWYNQLGSFDKNHILKHFEGRLEPFILSSKLEGISLANLLARNHITSIDILHIDTEGYDWAILSQLDLNRFQPGFILFEHNHLSSQDLKAAHAFLNDQYLLFKIGIDMLAVSKDHPASFLEKIKTNFLNN